MFDVIIIGSGISGLNFALRAAEKYRRVLIVTKKKIAETATNFAQGGIAAVLSKTDDFRNHVRDTLEAGCFHNNRRAVEYVVRHGPGAVERLMRLGVPFATKDGELLLAREGGHSRRRIAFVSDMTGQAIEKVLISKAKKNPRITILEHAFAAELLVQNRRCFGIRVLLGKKFEKIISGMTVLATGGTGQLFEQTTNPDIATGDGLAMAKLAGCGFRDLEFIQFHPTSFTCPKRGAGAARGGSRFLISEAVRGEGAYLRNAAGKRFMAHIHKLAELAPRDIVSRAIFEEEKKGPVFLDLRHKEKTFLQARFPQIYETLKANGLRMELDLIPVSPAAHYSCGGIAVNLRGETGIKNLYAFGEVAGTGVHGANRLASNSLLEALVFSDRILKTAPGKPQRAAGFKSLRYRSISTMQKKSLAEIRRRLKTTMWVNVGIVRSAASLKKALAGIARLEQSLAQIPQFNRQAWETKNMLAAARLIVEAALKRKKSLGCHYVV